MPSKPIENSPLQFANSRDEATVRFGKSQEIECKSKNKMQAIHHTICIDSSRFSESENAGCKADSASSVTLHIIRFVVLRK